MWGLILRGFVSGLIVTTAVVVVAKPRKQKIVKRWLKCRWCDRRGSYVAWKEKFGVAAKLWRHVRLEHRDKIGRILIGRDLVDDLKRSLTRLDRKKSP